MKKLRECPFCGGKGKIQYHQICNPARTKYQPAFSVECENCFTSTFQYFEYKKQAIETWNTRITDPRPETIR